MLYRDNGRYGASDITILASHLFRGKIRQMAWQAQPASVLWIVMENGKLVGLTYEEEQNVFACHEHCTDGLVKSVAVIQGACGDEVHFGVLRGAAYSIERFEPVTSAAGALGNTANRRCFLDSSYLKISETPFTTVGPMLWLAGKTVSCCADNEPLGSLVVDGSGNVTLPLQAHIACVGLPYTMEVQPMRLETQMQDGTAQGRKIKVTQAVLRLLDSYGGNVASRIGATPTPINYESTLEYMIPPPLPESAFFDPIELFTGDKHVNLDSRHGESVDVIVYQSDPLPFTLVGLVVLVDIYGN
jgi:hypothetical protein